MNSIDTDITSESENSNTQLNSQDYFGSKYSESSVFEPYENGNQNSKEFANFLE